MLGSPWQKQNKNKNYPFPYEKLRHQYICHITSSEIRATVIHYRAVLDFCLYYNEFRVGAKPYNTTYLCNNNQFLLDRRLLIIGPLFLHHCESEVKIFACKHVCYLCETP